MDGLFGLFGYRERDSETERQRQRDRETERQTDTILFGRGFLIWRIMSGYSTSMISPGRIQLTARSCGRSYGLRTTGDGISQRHGFHAI